MSRGEKKPVPARRMSSAEAKRHRKRTQAVVAIMDVLADLQEPDRSRVFRAVREAMGVSWAEPYASIPSVWTTEPTTTSPWYSTAGTPDVGKGNNVS